jgi:hypothetical protein
LVLVPAFWQQLLHQLEQLAALDLALDEVAVSPGLEPRRAIRRRVELTTITLVADSRGSALICRVSANPSIRGICTSVTTTGQGVSAQRTQRLLAIGGRQHEVPGDLQHRLHRRAGGQRVVGHQHPRPVGVGAPGARR